MSQEIGARVRESMPRQMTQRSLAESAGMTADAISRALNGERAFSSIELARIADALDADLHWLITGTPDPFAVRVAARHQYDAKTGTHAVPGHAQDKGLLADVALAYRQVHPAVRAPSDPIPETALAVREILGSAFVRRFAEAIETAFDVDVIRLGDLSTDYCLAVAGRSVVVLASNANWFRSNFSLAHELGHLALRHHDAGGGPTGEQETAANAFAADLLLPRERVHSVPWDDIGARRLAQFVWDAGISTDFLARRLDHLGIPTSQETRTLLAQPTQRLLRRHGGDLGEGTETVGTLVVFRDPITERMAGASSRRFPAWLLAAHEERVASGELAPGTLAWMLDADEADILADATPAREPSADEVAALLGL